MQALPNSVVIGAMKASTAKTNKPAPQAMTAEAIQAAASVLIKQKAQRDHAIVAVFHVGDKYTDKEGKERTSANNGVFTIPAAQKETLESFGCDFSKPESVSKLQKSGFLNCWMV